MMNSCSTDKTIDTLIATSKAALKLSAAVFGLTLAGQAIASPANSIWTGAIDENWDTEGNWIAGHKPSASSPYTFVTPAGSMNAPIIDGTMAEANGLFLGSQGRANLTIRNGGQLDASNVVIGNSTNNAAFPGIANESGLIQLTGTGSQLLADYLTVGYYGTGDLEISDGATATINDNVTLAGMTGSQGLISVSGSGSHLDARDLLIGVSGHGVLSVTHGGTVSSKSSSIATSLGSSGAAILSGANSNWDVTGSLAVGGAGFGELDIEDGATVSATTAISIGQQNTATGIVTLSGAGSALTSNDLLYIGDRGDGYATVLNGATLAGARLILGLDAAGQGTLEIDGANSIAKSTNYVMIGYSGAGTATVSNGGTLKADGARGITLGFIANSHGTLNIGAAAGDSAAAAGLIDAQQGIKFGAGAGNLVLNHTDSNYTLAAPISGAGTINVLSGTTIFSGNNGAFEGGLLVHGGKAILAGETNALTTEIKEAVLQIGNGGTSGSLTSNIQNNGSLVFNRSDALTHSHVILGTGDVSVAGGTITLTGMNTFSGATNIQSGATLALSGQGRINQSSGVTVDGTFDVSAASSAQIKDLGGKGTVVVGDAGLMIGNASQVFSGRITGSGGVMLGAGSLTLTGTNDFSGGLGISSGAMVNIGDGGTTGSITGDVTNYGTLVFDRQDNLSHTGQISGQGTVVKTGANTVSFFGPMSGVQLFVEEGTAKFFGSISNSGVALATDSTIVFANAANTTYRGILSGDGSVIKEGAGTTTFSGENSSFAGNTTVTGGKLLLTGSLDGGMTVSEGGTLQVGDGKKNGNLLADTLNNGTLIFDQITDYTYTGALSGNGNLIKRGDNTLLLSGDYHYKGSTVVEGGRVRLSSALDSATSLVLNSGTFDLDGRDQSVSGLSGTTGAIVLGGGSLTVTLRPGETNTFGGSISGTGTLYKAGDGTLNLTGSSGSTGFGSLIHVEGGILAVNGMVQSLVSVQNGGTLGGTGTAGTVIVNQGGTLSPGNSIGTLNIASDVTFEAGSIFSVEVDANGNSDRVNAAGKAIIKGGNVSVRAAAGNYRWSSDYVILSAQGGVTGQFASAGVDLPFLTPTLRYSPNDVTLELRRNDRSFVSTATTHNQKAVAKALDASGNTTPLHRSVAAQLDTASAVQAYEALSGELWATTGTFMVDRTRRIGEMVISRMEQTDVISQALAHTGSASRQTSSGRTGFWGQVIGGWNTVKGDGNAARATQDGAGFITGLDTQLASNWRMGLAFNHGEEKVQVNGHGNQATVTGSAVAAYVSGGFSSLRLRAGGSYGWQDVKGTRKVAFTGVSENVSGRYDGKSISAFGELSYAASFGKAQIEPFAGVNHVHLKTDGFAEQNGPLGALGVDSQTRNVTYTTLGLRLGAVLPVSDQAAVTPRASAAWLRGFGDLAAEGNHTLVTNKAFSIEGLPATRNALRLEAGLQANIVPGGSLGISYVGNLADRWTDHGMKLGFSYSF